MMSEHYKMLSALLCALPRGVDEIATRLLRIVNSVACFYLHFG